MEEDPKEVWAYVFISTSQPRRVVQAVRGIPGVRRRRCKDDDAPIRRHVLQSRSSFTASYRL